MAKSLVFDCSTRTTTLVDVPDVAPIVPDAVAPLQIRRALRAAGKKAGFDTWIASQSEDVQETWSLSRAIQRNGTLVRAAITAGKLTDAQADALFIDALNYGG